MKVWTYFGDSTNTIESEMQGLVDRGGRIVSLSIAYGPPPAKVAGLPTAPDNSWHAMVVVDTAELRDA
jgi:hypothetical protein